MSPVPLAKLDIQKLSGRVSSRQYLRYKIDGANRTLAKMSQAELDLEEKFAQADQRARDLALAKAETLEKLAKAERSRVEAERSKVAAIHYQDPWRLIMIVGLSYRNRRLGLCRHRVNPALMSKSQLKSRRR